MFEDGDHEDIRDEHNSKKEGEALAFNLFRQYFKEIFISTSWDTCTTNLPYIVSSVPLL